jgi:CheY-like chemotaxis protein
MRALVLDDDLSRLELFKTKALVGHEVTTVSHVSDCIEQLTDHEFELIFMDHDLDGKVYVPSGPGTGYAVAEWLRDNPSRKPKQIILHTFNQFGAAKMLEALPEATYVPGAWLVRWDVE